MTINKRVKMTPRLTRWLLKASRNKKQLIDLIMRLALVTAQHVRKTRPSAEKN